MNRTSSTSDRARTGGIVTMTPVDVDELPWVAVDGCPGVDVKTLGAEQGCVAALIVYRPGAATHGRPHPEAGQHLWVISGHALVAGRRLRAGSYTYVPAGSEHPIEAGADGCMLLQLHVPYLPRHAVRPPAQ